MIKTKKSLMLILTILLSMVFVVNLGYTFAAIDYQMIIKSKEDIESYNYLNDVVVNNSTTLIPIPYTEGTVVRDINFDYGFSENMDIAIEYNLKYVDNNKTEIAKTVDNVQLNFSERDNYLLDTPNVSSISGTEQYNNLSNRGTLYYMGYVPAGSGNKKIINSVTFIAQDNQVETYIATENVTLYSTAYNVGDIYSALEFEYVKSDIARYWEATYTKDGGTTTISEAEYNQLFEGERIFYTPYRYKTVQDYKINNGDYISVANATVSEYENYLNVYENYFSINNYVCIQGFTTSSATYSVGQTITAAVYNNLSASLKYYFEPIYTCSTAYSVVGRNTQTITKDTEISASEFYRYHEWERKSFAPKDYYSYANHNLVIEIKVHSKLNYSATSLEDDATSFYTDSHYFANCSLSTNKTVFNQWINYKKNTASDGSCNPEDSSLLIYNSHGTFDSGIPYIYDLGENQEMTDKSKTTNIKSSYIYFNNKFYLYAGGNASHAGVGVYYMTNTEQTVRVSVGVSWYDANGNKLSALSATISNVELGYYSDFTEESNHYWTYNKKLGANSYGYIDILEYIRINTIGGHLARIGNKLVITSINAEFTTSSSSTTRNNTNLEVVNSSRATPSLISSVYLANGISTTINTNISIVNETDQPMKVSSITLTPRFYAYNAQTSADTLIINEIYVNFATSAFKYNTSSWSVTKNTATNNGKTAYTYTFSSNGIYIAPRSSLVLIEGVELTASDIVSQDWTFALAGNGEEYEADYWFDIATSNLVGAESAKNATTTTDYELMTILTTNAITNQTAYIAMRNNTSQKITAFNFSGKLYNEDNGTVTASWKNYITGSTSTSTTINISASIELLPGESLILCKITGSSSNAFSLTNVTKSATVGGTPSTSTMYVKRDMASGNLSVCNSNSSSQALAVTIKTMATSPVTITNLSTLNGGDSKWSYANSKFSYGTKVDGEFTNGKLRTNQFLNVITNYYDANLTATIG